MKLVIISGPTGAGKDTVIDNVINEVRKTHGNIISNAEYFKTRPRRPKEADTGYFISPEAFDEMKSRGEIALHGKIGDYEVGHSMKEFEKSPVMIVNIDDKKARALKDWAIKAGGSAMTIFIHAPEESRKLRYRLREGLLFEEPAQFRMDHDVTDANPENHKDFDLVVENKEDGLDGTMAEIMPRINKFIDA
jgi:guanylate kinase